MDDFGLWDVFVSVFWFMMLVAWISVLFRIVGDIVRDSSLGGVAKAGWMLFLLVVPWLGALAYLVVRGGSMNERAVESAHAADAQLRAYVRDAAGGEGVHVASELRELAALRDSGVLDAEEYQQAKKKILV